MKYLITIITILSLLSCHTPLYIYSYFYLESSDTQYTVDSLANEYNLQIPSINEWASMSYLTDTLEIDNMYGYQGKRNDSTFVFSVIGNVVKFRIEAIKK